MSLLKPAPARGGIGSILRGRDRWIGAAVSGALLATAFPPLEWAFMAWIAWVPLIWSVAGGTRGDAIRNGALAGGVFWGFSLFWLTKVTGFGWAGLGLYCALYTIPFTLFIQDWSARFGLRSFRGNLCLSLGAATVWAGFEYLRGTLFTGFPWNAMGVSQYRNLSVIQMASWGGVYSVSWLLVACNGLLASGLGRIRVSGRGVFPFEGVVLLALIALAAGRGAIVLRTRPPSEASVRLALIQPAIPQNEKWTQAFENDIHVRLARLSEDAVREGAPDLVVWPETAVAESPRISGPVHDLLCSVTGSGTPLLLGAVDYDRSPSNKVLYYNSSMLVGPGAVILRTYDKQHLVVYGEYVPFGDSLPFLRSLSPFDYDISPGAGPVLFHLKSKNLPFAVLICFEDVIARLSREAVRLGARLLVNQTNDAWFDGSSGSRQHMAQAVFRCIENRVPMVRCGNSGVTSWIDSTGCIGGGSSHPLPIVDATGKPARGYSLVDVPWRRSVERSFYAVHGDLFGKSCAGVGVGWLILRILLGLTRLHRTKSARGLECGEKHAILSGRKGLSR
jgi:apolipoprotein N-acyltransferase